jgi:hypothetical protein
LQRHSRSQCRRLQLPPARSQHEFQPRYPMQGGREKYPVSFLKAAPVRANHCKIFPTMPPMIRKTLPTFEPGYCAFARCAISRRSNGHHFLQKVDHPIQAVAEIHRHIQTPARPRYLTPCSTQLALLYDSLVQLHLTLDSVPKLPIFGR